jgi:signal transduction histidine kinase
MSSWPVNVHLLPAALPYAISGLIVLGLGYFVWFRNPKSETNRYFSLMMLSCALWQIFYSIMMVSVRPSQAFLFARALHTAVVFIPTLFYGFVLNMLSIEYKYRMKICFLISGLFLSLLWATTSFVSGNILYWWGYSGKGGWGYTAFVCFFFTLFLLSFFHLRGAYTSTIKIDAVAANRIKYVFLAFFIAVLASIDYLPVYGIAIYPTGFAFMLIFSIVTTYAIAKHQILDINFIIRKSAVYSLTLFSISTFYTILIFAVIQYSRSYLGHTSVFLTTLTALTISISFAPLHNFLSFRVNHLFFHSSPAQLAERNALMIQELQKQDQMRAVATLAAGMAHEIKNPLTALKTFTEYLPEKSKDPVFMEKFQKIVSFEVRKIDGIVKQLLDFSKPTPPSLISLDIREPLNDTLELLSNDLLARNIQLNKNLTPAIILGDKKQLSQVFLNLFLNSIEAMPKGGTLSVESEINNDRVIIVIRDTGVGIRKEDLGRVFDPFFTNKPDGTGLGLSMAQSIIEEHKGKIRIFSTLGQGTDTRIELKCV